jgi:GTPase Era involved in 16S rRNA processing
MGTPASSTTKTGRHDIAESGVKHQKSNQIIFMDY